MFDEAGEFSKALILLGQVQQANQQIELQQDIANQLRQLNLQRDLIPQYSQPPWPFYCNGIPVGMIVPQTLNHPASSSTEMAPSPPRLLTLEPKPNGTWWVVADQDGNEMTGYGAFTSPDATWQFIYHYFPTMAKPRSF